MEIRVATAADIPPLDALIERSVRGLGARFYTAQQIEGALGHALGLDRQLIADGTYYCVSDPGSPSSLVASGGWSYRRTLFGSDHFIGADGGRDGALLDPAVDAAKIRAIFVDPEWAGRGLGTMLLRHCEQAARAAGFGCFEMGSTLGGVSLYRREGYRELAPVSVSLPNEQALQVIRMRKP